jgi:hypothetical protein
MHPIIINTEAVSKAFGLCQSVLSVESTDFVASRPSIYPGRIIRLDEPRLPMSTSGCPGLDRRHRWIVGKACLRTAETGQYGNQAKRKEAVLHRTPSSEDATDQA